MAQMLDIVGTRAVALIGPVWSSVSRVADSSRALSDRFTGLLESLPSIGGRRLLEEADAAGAGQTVGALLAVGGAGAAGRGLQQSVPLLSGLGQLAQGIAQGINAAASAIPSAIPGLPANITIPGLPQLLPNGSSNPLVGAITDVTNAIEGQILNPNGCPIYCIDLRSEKWWVDPSAGEGLRLLRGVGVGGSTSYGARKPDSRLGLHGMWFLQERTGVHHKRHGSTLVAAT
jgi:hypothetical protein